MSAFILWAWGTYLDDLAAAYGVDRLAATQAVGAEQFSGPAGTRITVGTAVSTVPTSADDPAPTFLVTLEGVIPDAGAGTGTILLSIEAQDAGAAGEVAANAITAPGTPLPGVTMTNPLPTGGGSDPETDESLRLRVLQAIVGVGGANVAAYVRWASAWPGVGQVKVVPNSSGPGTVMVLIDDASGQPLPSSVVAGLQAALDPVPGQGAGTAPVGARVTVLTSIPLAVSVAVTAITYESGYSADGTGATIAVQDGINAAIAAYLLTVRPGSEVVLSHVAGIISTWPGVHDATGITINGIAANVPVTLSPPQSPYLQSLVL